MSRISTSQIYDNSAKHVAKAQEREWESAKKVATQKAITEPHQDPSGWLKAANLKDNHGIQKSIAKTARDATHALNMTHTVFENIQEIVQSAYDLAIQQSGSNLGGPLAREHAKKEAAVLLDSLIQNLNYKFGTRTLLGGFQSNSTAFDQEGNFLGDNGEMLVEIDRGLRIPVNITADTAVYGKNLADGQNIIEPFKQLLQGVREDNSELIHQSLTGFNKANDQISFVRSEIGVRLKNIDLALNRFSVDEAEMLETISTLEDADSIKTLSDLARDKAIMKAAVMTSQRLLNDQPGDMLFQ